MEGGAVVEVELISGEVWWIEDRPALMFYGRLWYGERGIGSALFKMVSLDPT